MSCEGSAKDKDFKSWIKSILLLSYLSSESPVSIIKSLLLNHKLVCRAAAKLNRGKRITPVYE